MLSTANLLAYLSAFLVSLSTRLSASAVLGFLAAALLSQQVSLTSGLASARTQVAKAAPIEVVRSKPIPLITKPEVSATPEAAPVPGSAESSADLVVARRSRHRRDQETAEDTSVPVRQNSAIALSAEPEKPAAVARDKDSAPEAEPPKLDVWSDAEVIAALRDCVKLLGPISAEVELTAPVKHEQCGAPAPVMLQRLGSGAHKVEMKPPAMINCAMVAHLYNWVEKTLQPTAQEMLGSPVTRLRNASGYVCRNRNGSASHSDRLSEHALANAIDIAAFDTADGRSIEVSRYWGATRRDLIAAKAAAAQSKDSKQQSAAGEVTSDKVDPTRRQSAISGKQANQRGRTGSLDTAELQKLGRVASDISLDPQTIPSAGNRESDAKEAVEGKFLRRLHSGACGVFSTVLGPEANEAHRNHFHFDLAPRKRRAFCE